VLVSRRLRRTLVGVAVAWLAVAAWAAPPKRYMKVQRFRPHHAQTLLPVDTKISVRFSRPLDMTSVGPETAFVRKLSGEAVESTYDSEARGRTLVIRPTLPLDGATDYEIVVRPGLRSRDGRTLRGERHANFYTKTVVSPFALMRPDQLEDLASTMIEGRAGHSAAVLWDGRVLLAGGMTNYVEYAATGDLFDPSTKQFRPSGGQLAVPRAWAPAVETATGALLVGGSNAGGALRSTESYAPSILSFQVGPPMNEQRDFVAAVRLRTGAVLVVGGLSYTSSGAIYSQTAEILTQGATSFRFTNGAPLSRRAGHTATLLPDGRVFIVGGQSGGASTPVTAELFDPATETFTKVARNPEFHRRLHTATLVDDLGHVLVADGGAALLEIFDVRTEAFAVAGASSSISRTGAPATLLPSGDVLIAGGLEDNGNNPIELDGFDIWRPTNGGTIYKPLVVFSDPRFGHTATTLPDGRVLYAGGFGPVTPESLATGVLFTPDDPNKPK
jgi:hypothetical protein